MGKDFLLRGLLYQVVWVGKPWAGKPCSLPLPANVFIAQRKRQQRFDPMTSDFVFLKYVLKEASFQVLVWPELQHIFGNPVHQMQELSKNLVPVSLLAKVVILPCLPSSFFKHVVPSTPLSKKKMAKIPKTKRQSRINAATSPFDTFLGWRLHGMNEIIQK